MSSDRIESVGLVKGSFADNAITTDLLTTRAHTHTNTLNQTLRERLLINIMCK